MGYDLHITRRKDWADESGPEITAEEWLSYIATDRSLRLDKDAEAARDRGTDASQLGNMNAKWYADPKTTKEEDACPIWYFKGNIYSKNPPPEMVRKMFLIADELNARLVGDEGEEYDSTGEVVGQAPSGKLGKKKWWKFW